MYSSVELSQLSQWLCYDDSTINIVVVIIVIIIIMDVCIVHCTGYIPGLCHHTNLTVGHRYVILANHDDNDQYRPNGAFGVDDRQQLTQLATACGLQAVYPRGMYQREKVW